MATKQAAPKKARTGAKQDTASKTRRSANSKAESSVSSITTAPTTGKEQGSLLNKLFIDMLKDMYWAEKHLVQALTTMQTVATTEALQDAFEDHRYVTEKHASRLEKVFRLLGKEPEAKKCDAMEGLTKEATAMIQETKPGTMTRDAALIIAAQKVEHYEIASYGSLVAVARTLGHDRAAALLEKTLWEEEDTDMLLTDIAEGDVNPMADDEPQAEEDETEDEEA